VKRKFGLSLYTISRDALKQPAKKKFLSTRWLRKRKPNKRYYDVT